jgi:hypothetical protein
MGSEFNGEILRLANTARQVTIPSGEAERHGCYYDQIDERDVSAPEMAPASLGPVVIIENRLHGRG